MRTERVGKFYAHMAKAADADDADFFAGACVPVAQRRPCGDACAEQRRDGGQIFFGVADAQNKMFVHHDGSRISAIGVLAVERAIIGADETRSFTILFQPVLAGRTCAAGINHTADADEFTHLEFFDIATHGRNAAHDFMSGNARILRACPFAARGVQIGMAHAAVKNVDGDVFGFGFAAVDRVRRQGRCCRLGGERFGFHGSSLFYGNGFREISWLVHIRAFGNRDMVGKQLHGNGI